MELQFTITPAHTASRLQAALQREMQQHQQQHARIQAQVTRWQDRWLAPLLFCLGLGGGMVCIAWGGQPLTTEKGIAMLVTCVLFSLLWWRFAPRLLAVLRTYRTRPRQPPLQGLYQRLAQATLRTQLQRQEGRYHLQLDSQGFTLSHAQGASNRVEWAQIVRLQATPDFYRLSTAALAAKGQAYHLPRHSNAMDPALYQQQLALWLQHCPVALETIEPPISTAD